MSKSIQLNPDGTFPIKIDRAAGRDYTAATTFTVSRFQPEPEPKKKKTKKEILTELLGVYGLMCMAYATGRLIAYVIIGVIKLSKLL